MELQDAIDHRRHGRLAEAENAGRQAVREHPFSPQACHVLGMVLLERGQASQAVELMRRSVALAPRTPQFRVNFAGALGRLGRFQEGLSELTQALALGGGQMPELHNLLGGTLDGLGRLRESAEAFRQSIRLRPSYAEAHYNLANLLSKLGDMAGALAGFQEALRLRPGYFKAAWRCAESAAELGDAPQATAAFRRAMDAYPRSAAAHSGLLYTMHYSPCYSPVQLMKEAKCWAGRPAQFPEADCPHDNQVDAERRLRIGYLSPDFRLHTIAHLIEPLLETHDRKQLEVWCYSAVQSPDDMTRRLSRLADAWVDVSRLRSAAAAQRIRNDRIDILIDLAGHMGDHCLLVMARRPAPVQVQLGYAGTTGVPSIDYRITDNHCDPAGTEMFYTERLVRMPDCPWLYKPSDPSPSVGPLPALSAGHVTFGCLNKLVKVTDEAIALWSRILSAVPGSRLILLSPADNPKLLERFSRHGVETDRIELAGRRSREAYLELFNRIDIALDPFPYNGDTTTCDGFWMGVPLVTLAGQAFVSRRGVSHLCNVGLNELVASSQDEYVQIATALAGDLPRLADLRHGLRERMSRSPLMDYARYAANLEAAYRQMWRRWCAGRITCVWA